MDGSYCTDLLNMKRMLAVMVLLEYIVGAVQGAKVILASPQVASHILEQIALGEGLALRGHQVYMAIGSRYPKPENIEKRGITVLQYKIPDDVLYAVSHDYEQKLNDIIFQNKPDDALTLSGRLLSELGNRDCFYMMHDKKFLSKVKAAELDFAIIEPFVLAPCNLILPKYLGIRFASMTPFFIPWNIGIPVLPSFYAIMTTWTSVSDITIISKLSNIAYFLLVDKMVSNIAPANLTLLKQYAPGYQSWTDLERLSELFMSEVDHHLGNLIPQLPNYVSVAGLTSSMPKKLPTYFSSIIENSTEGIILWSFGSSAYYLPNEILLKFLTALSKLKETVIAKVYVPENVTVPENVKVYSWVPQNDILGHSNTKLFITHCGNNGQHEALYHGVPMLGFPLFAEQHYNSERVYKKGFGLEMNIYKFTSDELYNNILEILHNPKYRMSIKRASGIFRDQPMTPRERGVFWIEHVIKHGGKHLRSPAIDMNVYQFLMLDILALFVIGVSIVTILIGYFFKWLCKFNHSKEKVKQM